ncbi:spore maturation protein [Gammaproteobacteria bacterium]|nr:spore maturation protein [Gammaproteobacteria bacterium]
MFGLSLSECSAFLLVLFAVFLPLHGHLNQVAVFDEFVAGGRKGIDVLIKIMPFIVGMVSAIGMLRASGFFENMHTLLSGPLSYLGVDPDLLTLALIRPFSGAASNASVADIVSTHGPDALVSRIAATVMGSTETVFYVIPIYFGAIGISQVRFTIWVSLMADLIGFFAAIWVCTWLL